MRNAWALLVVGGMALGLAGGCAHIAATQATFTRTDTALVLQVDRHVEEIVRGPDIEEDQTLVLELRDYQIGKWLAVPSTNATARLEVRRFGAPSHGEVFAGWVKVRKVTATKVVADVKLVVTARTASGSYVQQTKFKDQYEFFRAAPPD